MHIQSAADLEPQSIGFANRAAESINIIGNVLEDLLNGFGSAISDVTGQHHGSHLNISNTGHTDGRARFKDNRGHFNPAPITLDAERVQTEIDKNVPSI